MYDTGMNSRRDVYTALLYARHWPLLGSLAYLALKLLGVEVPRSVKIGKNVLLVHGAFGLVIHPNTRIGDGVKLYPGITLGRADIHLPIEQSSFEGIEIGHNAIISPGAKVLCKDGVLVVGQGSVIGANAVLLESCGEKEIWAGIPARKIGQR